MKINPVVRIVVFSILIVLLLAVLAGALVAGVAGTFFAPPDSHQTAVEEPAKVYRVSDHDIRELEIRWVAGDIQITAGDTDGIEFSETSGTRCPMVWRESGHKLIIEYSEHEDLSFLKHPVEKSLRIQVPEGWKAEQLDIETVSAELKLTHLTAEELELQSVSADCTLEACTMGRVTVETVSGNVRFDGTLERLDAEAVSGNYMIAVQKAPEKIEIDGVSGDVQLTMPAETGFRAKLSGTGSFESDFQFQQDGRYYRCGDEECRIEMDGVSSSLRILKAS